MDDLKGKDFMKFSMDVLQLRAQQLCHLVPLPSTASVSKTEHLTPKQSIWASSKTGDTKRVFLNLSVPL